MWAISFAEEPTGRGSSAKLRTARFAAPTAIDAELSRSGNRAVFRCTRCRETKPRNAFYPRSGRVREVHEWCRACFREYRVAYYSARRASELRRVRANRDRLVREWRERRLAYLRQHPCVDCGEADPVVLEFDHMSDKLGDIAVLARKWRWSAIEREIAKCEIRCANCHRRKTARERGYYLWRVQKSGRPRQDSNLQLLGPQPSALSIELRGQTSGL